MQTLFPPFGLACALGLTAFFLLFTAELTRRSLPGSSRKEGMRGQGLETPSTTSHYFFADNAARTDDKVFVEPSFSFFLAMNLAYSSTKILPGGRKSNSPG